MGKRIAATAALLIVIVSALTAGMYLFAAPANVNKFRDGAVDLVAGGDGYSIGGDTSWFRGAANKWQTSDDVNMTGTTTAKNLNVTNDARISDLYANSTMIRDESGTYQNRTDAILYPEIPVDYLIWNSSVNHYAWAKNGHTGEVTANADFSTLINALFPADIKIKNGTFTVNTKITLLSNSNLYGSGSSTILIAGSGFTDDLIFVTGKTNVNIGNMFLDGNLDSARSGINLSNCVNANIREITATRFEYAGIYLSGSNRSIPEGVNIDNCYLYLINHNANAAGIIIDDTTFTGNDYNTIDNCIIDYCKYGVYLIIGYNNVISNSVISWSDLYGVYSSTSAERLEITDCRLNHNDFNGAYIQSDRSLVDGTYIIANGYEGIQLRGKNSIISNCIFSVNGGSAGATDRNCGLLLGSNAHHHIITANQFGYYGDTTRYEVVITNTAYNVTIADNILYAGTQVIKDNGGTAIHINHNDGFFTESSGISSIASGTTSITFAHKLSVVPSPSWFTITFTENPTNLVSSWWLTCNATHAVLNINTDPGVSNLDFGWKAIKP